MVGRVVDLTFDCIAFCLLRLRFFFFRLVYIYRAQQKYRGVLPKRESVSIALSLFRPQRGKKHFAGLAKRKQVLQSVLWPSARASCAVQ